MVIIDGTTSNKIHWEQKVIFFLHLKSKIKKNYLNKKINNENITHTRRDINMYNNKKKIQLKQASKSNYVTNGIQNPVLHTGE